MNQIILKRIREYMLEDLKILLPGKDGYIKADYRISMPRKLIK